MKFEGKVFLSIFAASILLWSCNKSKDNVEVPNEEELITTLKYTLVPTGGGSTVEYVFRDLDGDGGTAPTITSSGTLSANKTYTGTITLLNEQKTPADDITSEVQTEGTEHQFFYKTNLSSLGIAYADADANGKPIGIKTNVTTQAAGTGTLQITLRHQPNKSAAGVTAGDITNAGGETDIEVTFNVQIQ